MAQIAVDENVEVGPGPDPAGVIVIVVGKDHHIAASGCRSVIGTLMALGHCPVAGGAVAARRRNGFVGLYHRPATIRINVTESAVSIVYTNDRVLASVSVTVHAAGQGQDSAGGDMVQTTGEAAPWV